jgi:hypothetical protein
MLLTACKNPFVQLNKTTIEVANVPSKETQEPQQKVFSCDMLKTPGAKQDCLNGVNSFIEERINSEITGTFDLNRCDELGSDLANDCKRVIQESGVKGPVPPEEANSFEQAVNDYGDPSKCATLTAPGLKEYCEKKINEYINMSKVWEIVGSKDPTKCDTMEGEYINRCKEEFGINTEVTEKAEAEQPVQPAE